MRKTLFFVIVFILGTITFSCNERLSLYKSSDEFLTAEAPKYEEFEKDLHSKQRIIFQTNCIAGGNLETKMYFENKKVGYLSSNTIDSVNFREHVDSLLRLYENKYPLVKIKFLGVGLRDLVACYPPRTCFNVVCGVILKDSLTRQEIRDSLAKESDSLRN
jgi:hypothetical protein